MRSSDCHLEGESEGTKQEQTEETGLIERDDGWVRREKTEERAEVDSQSEASYEEDSPRTARWASGSGDGRRARSPYELRRGRASQKAYHQYFEGV
ncbi:uncharacterized protein EI97DRAFT_436975 [Westerdykella ornata]|uniref:Uncharacterized protein n=1 Tax=Westerdykella ornata TaxID=318751 RepID=A0A6A6J7G4_WESOR|nr:uncharacterized protein EI97DRAFT_436975 [Westerdykella ornata]KAF2272342.1 hypothetical protein EI97DRAFT_436975 [Westerdykella ornata]